MGIDNPSQQSVFITRPMAISIIAGVHIAACIFSLTKNIISPDYTIGPWYPLYFDFCTVLFLISMIGLWKMKKWGYYLFIAVFLVSQLVLRYKGIWSAWMLILPIVLICIFSTYYKKMN